MSPLGDARGREGRDGGEGPVSYLASILLIAAIVGGAVFTPLGPLVMEKTHAAVCKVVVAGGLVKECKPPKDDAGGPGGPSPGPSDSPQPGPKDDPFQPERCIIATETTKSKTKTRVLIFQITTEEKVKLTQWSDGTVTVDYEGSVGGGLEGSLDIPGLKPWNGSGSVGGSFGKSSGSGGRWLFDKNKTGDQQEDLKLNHADAENFIKYLQGQKQCQRNSALTPYGLDSGAFCSYYNEENNMPDLPPTEQPDLDLTKSTIEASGDFKFGGSLTKGDGKGGKNTIVGGQGKGVTGSVSDDVVVMRGNGEVTFVYTMELGGKMGVGYQGEGSIMQQVYVTYKSEDYDREEKEDKPHHPTKIRITKAQRDADGNPGGEGKISAPAGPFTVQVEGGGGKTDTFVHTEVAELTLDNPGDSTTVQDWLDGKGDHPAASLPFPGDYAGKPPPDASDFTKLMHDKGKLSSLDYNVNIDWFKFAWAIGLGYSTGKWSNGFKLFGMEVSGETETQTLTGNPQYAGAPGEDGNRPWYLFTNCTKVTPVE